MTARVERRTVERPDGPIALRVSGEGPLLLLLHGWPETSIVWEKVRPGLEARFRVAAPDLRGFGDSLIPSKDPSMAEHVDDLAAVLDSLGAERAGLVGHDVGAQVAQAFAFEHPDRVSGLFFFDCPHPGVGRRWVEAGHVNEIWYQSFHQTRLASALAGGSRESVRLYLAHFLAHWAGEAAKTGELLDPLTDAFARPGRLDASFAWYRMVNPLRLAQIDEGPQPRARIAVPARCYWGERDPIIPPRFAEGIEAYFDEIEIEIAEEAGHFVFWEKPEASVSRLKRFFEEIGFG